MTLSIAIGCTMSPSRSVDSMTAGSDADLVRVRSAAAAVDGLALRAACAVFGRRQRARLRRRLPPLRFRFGGGVGAPLRHRIEALRELGRAFLESAVFPAEHVIVCDTARVELRFAFARAGRTC